MKKYGVNELREMFLSFFEEKEHLRMKSFSLVPHNDKSLLLINSGMAPLKPYFTGQEIPPRRRVTTCQKCIRTGDIENIGKTARHGTFFEMLGNFSFGDYFKKDSIRWAWEFLTERVGLDKERLYPSVYLDDDEAFSIWEKDIGISKDRIFRFGKEDNFWEHGAGPCGPCSEIYYDRGERFGCGKPGCTVGCDCDRYMEVWNIVFSQFNNDGKGNYSDLIQKNIDTGMGLERLAVVCQDVDSLFDVDTNRALMDKAGELAGCRYEEDPVKDVSLRILADHVKSCTFMASDGIMPSNEGRGYVFRRLLRRAARHGRILGIPGRFMTQLSEVVISLSCGGYPELEEKKAMILRVIDQEEERFANTIDKGLEILNEMEVGLEEKKEKVLAGADAFKLYDTYGFPLDLTREILSDKGLSVDEEGFKKAMQVQRDTARKARKVTNYMGRDDVYQKLDPSLTTVFTGYEGLSGRSKITALVRLAPDAQDSPDGADALDEAGVDEIVDAVTDGERAAVITESTPFYAVMGGQVGDTGTIRSDGGEFEVKDTIHLQGGKIAHIGIMRQGMFRTQEEVELSVDARRRRLIARSHTATHLLQKALREVLGSHVEQAGAFYDDHRLRFDFTHFQAMSQEEIRRVEEIVNNEIAKCVPVETKEMSLEEARKSGAIALFGEKYGETVRVVFVEDFSIELCGGTHVKNTAEIQAMKIVSEQGIAAGVRRIEALTSDGLMGYFDDEEQLLKDAAARLKTDPAHLSERIAALEKELKEARSENESLRQKLANESMGEVEAEEIGGVKLVLKELRGVDMNGLRNLGDQLKDRFGEKVYIVLASESDGKPFLMAMATDAAVKQGAHAGQLIKGTAPILGGGGGGRPTMAQAGGKDASKLKEALAKAGELAKQQLG